MLSGVLLVFLLFLSFVVVDSHHPRVHCNGAELSANNASGVLKLEDKGCTHVLGDIVIANLTDIKLPMSVFRRVSHVQGSIIIWGNKNISPKIHFPQLLLVNSTILPSIVILENRNVHFSVGDHFKRAMTMYTNLTFAVLKNNPSISTDQYNLLYAAGFPKARFLTDSLHGSDICLENLFKPLAGILGFLFVALTVAFSTVSFYDWPKKHQ